MERNNDAGLVPPGRLQVANSFPVNERGDFVLYWMIAYRRLSWNYSLDRALWWSEKLDKPLVIMEALRCGYLWASDRFHRFIIDGMVEKIQRFRKTGILYYPYLEAYPNAGKGFLEKLALRSCLVITDDFPCFFLPRMVSAAAAKLSVRLERVDSNGLLPMRQPARVFSSAYSFRRYLQQCLPDFILESPEADPLQEVRLPEFNGLPQEITERWPSSEKDLQGGGHGLESGFPIDHSVRPSEIKGGSTAGKRALAIFLSQKLMKYGDLRNQPEEQVTSGLSPYLHWGHVSAHEVFAELAKREDWTLLRLGPAGRGKRAGFWGMSPNAEQFLDQVLTWRELGFNMCVMRQDYDKYQSLPAWAMDTLDRHRHDRRPYSYKLPELEQSRTHDGLWNAAQTQLVREGLIHNYLRMLWGKKILEWSPDPETALETMIHLNNKYALDGRDPNSYSGIFWILGRYDRPWGPERSIFGKIRYMSSENTARKLRVKEYIAKHRPETYPRE